MRSVWAQEVGIPSSPHGLAASGKWVALDAKARHEERAAPATVVACRGRGCREACRHAVVAKAHGRIVDMMIAVGNGE